MLGFAVRHHVTMSSSGPIWLSVLSTVLGGTLFVISDLWGLLMEGADRESGP